MDNNIGKDKAILKRDEIYKKEDAFADINQGKAGDYDNPADGCPNCKRHRIMIGDDKKHRCEKCGWCIEDNDFDREFIEYWIR